MNYRIWGALVLACLAGCSTSSGQLESASGTATQTRKYPDNYQALYRKVLEPAQRCLAGGISNRLTVDAQLYPDLGFGEITDSRTSIAGRNYYIKVKISKAGNGSEMTVWSGNTLAKSHDMNLVFSWAEGKTECL
ncbi:hypothetical protein GR212_15460 [Rhizobium lusitanum]|uniref:Lipoprotein n=1 Tax=Rhizobium lusitanum TaxID=293958 RepID=A0A6L9UA47_9HYPH|nr:hypothetical protein [Rhizobium lusitanum]NEI70977.1 hypothetical protein [Rhizobium lusitanum]